MHLCRDNLTAETLNEVMETLFTSAAIPSPATDQARPLFTFADETIRENRGLLPRFDEWGVVPEGHRGPRNNPSAAATEEQMGELPEPVETENSDKEEAPGGTDPSGGPASSSRTVPPGEDLQVISSSSDEDPSRGAPSRSTAEEEEESGAKGGRREPRTKSAHDKDVVAAKDAPREGAGAPQGGSRAHSPQPLKAKRRVWRMADE